MQHIANQLKQLLFFPSTLLSYLINQMAALCQGSWPLLAVAINMVWLSISILISLDQTE